MTTNKEAETDAHLWWRPMSSCPTGPKVMLLNAGGIAGVGWYDGKDKWWVAWHPLPKIPPDIKALIEPTYKPSNIGNLIGD